MVKRISPKKDIMLMGKVFKKLDNKTSGYYIKKGDIYKYSKGKAIKVRNF